MANTPASDLVNNTLAAYQALVASANTAKHRLGDGIGHANHHSQGRQLLQRFQFPAHHTRHKDQDWESTLLIIILLAVPGLII